MIRFMPENMHSQKRAGAAQKECRQEERFLSYSMPIAFRFTLVNAVQGKNYNVPHSKNRYGSIDPTHVRNLQAQKLMSRKLILPHCLKGLVPQLSFIITKKRACIL